MKYLFILLLLIHSAHAQSDSASILNEISEIRLTDINKAKQLLSSIDENAISNFTHEDRIKYFTLKAHSYAVNLDYEESKIWARKAIESTKIAELQARAKSILAMVNSSTGNYQESFLEMYELLDAVPNIKDWKLKDDLLQNALDLHLQLGILDKSHGLIRNILAIAKTNNSDKTYCYGYYHSANLSIKLQEYENAFSQIELGMKSCNKIKNQFVTDHLNFLISTANLGQGDFTSSKQLLNNLHSKIKKNGYELFLMDIKVQLAQVNLELGESALPYAKEAFNYAKHNTDTLRIKESAKILSKFYEQENQQKLARFYSKEYMKAALELQKQLDRKRIAYYQAMNIRKKNRKNLLNVQSEVALETP